MAAQTMKKETTGNIGFDDVSRLMQDSFRYVVISNEEANWLLTTLDDVIYATLKQIDNVCPLIRHSYAELVSKYMFHPVDGRTSYSSKGDDSLLIGSLLVVHENPKWLDYVRNYISLFRLYWMDVLHNIDNISREYMDCIGVPDTAKNYQETIVKKTRIEKKLHLTSDVAYGVFTETMYAVARITKIVRKLTYPYLRRVVVLAKHYGIANPGSFMENYQNGSSGIRVAIGRHDVRRGAFASSVDRWINNKILTFIREQGMLVKLPDRAFTHKNIVERWQSRNPQLSIEDIADKEGIKTKLLEESMSMVTSQGSYVDLDAEDETTSKHSHDYIDRSSDPNNPELTVVETVREYTALLRPRERSLISMLFGVEDPNAGRKVTPEICRSEQLRQVLAHQHNIVYANA